MRNEDQWERAEERRREEARREKKLDEIRNMLGEKEEQNKQEIEISVCQKKINEIKNLEKDIDNIKKKFKIIDVDGISMDNPIKRLKAELSNMEIHNIHLKAQKGKLEDRLNTLEKAYTEANKILENAHLEALDREEMDYMALQIENKKNELMSSRNYVREMQQVGWSFLPPKVADECNKTEMELDFIQNTIRKLATETAEAAIILDKTEMDLLECQKKYNEIKTGNTTMEKEIDEIVEEANKINSKMNIKEVQAKELQNATKSMKLKIQEAVETQENIWKQNELDKEQREKETNELKEKVKSRNKEVHDLKEEYVKLTEEAKEAEEKLSQMQKTIRDQKALLLTAESKHQTLESLTKELKEIKNDCAEISLETVVETKAKNTYYNIIEDMLGNLKILCRVKDSKTNNLKIIDDTNIVSKASADTKYEFDCIFKGKSPTEDIFEKIEHFYSQASDGYNCYIVAIGEKQSGKTYSILGKESNGLLFIGLKKIKELIRVNTKNHLTTRMFVCVVEIGKNQIYDLQEKILSPKFEVKKDYFGMTLIAHAKYTECFTEDAVKTCFLNAVKNRQNAFEALGTPDTNFVSIVTIQVYNKFQHRYSKGKITHIKFASISKNKGVMDELEKLSKGRDMNYNKSVLTELLMDCFGGNSKTCVLGCLDPSDAKDSLTTMKLVSGMKSIINSITRILESEEIYKLKNDIERVLRGLKIEFL